MMSLSEPAFTAGRNLPFVTPIPSLFMSTGRRFEMLSVPSVASVGMGFSGSSHGLDRDRNQALDFTKGILVLFMILYHWINYFLVSDGYVYRYLRFITPSFIFLAGFLVGNVYQRKYAAGDRGLLWRLTQRGVKVLGLFTLLNLGANLVSSRNYNGSALGLEMFVQNLFSIYVIGDGHAAVFEVLVPIGYLLILCAPLLFVSRFLRPTFPLVCALCFTAVFLLSSRDILVPNLELLSIGLLGVVVGHIPRLTLDRMVDYTPAIVAAYAIYLIAISVWNVIYVLQVAGVCLSLMILYLIGTRTTGQGLFQERLLMLGRYSLIAYIVQIFVLQLLVRVLGTMGSGIWISAVSLLAVLAFTQITVELIARRRQSSKALDYLYRFVFA